jgi:TRAP-type uncharacterized transport system fused permease subunit
MVTPPVALASFASAGLAGASPITTGWIAFRLSLVLFLIPFGFAFDPAVLGQGSASLIALAALSIGAATSAWAAGLVGHGSRPLRPAERGAYAAAGVAIILLPTGSMAWAGAMGAFLLLALWTVFRDGRA